MVSRRGSEPPEAILARRLLVSPNGRVHLPTCTAIGMHSLANGWGEVFEIAAAIAFLAEGAPFDSVREGRPKMPGPRAQHACHTCLHAFVRALGR